MNYVKKDIDEHIKSNLSEEKDMPYKTEPDIVNKTNSLIGDTYIEVSIEEQHIWMYINGELIVNSDIVTGNLSKKHYTRKGVFNLTYKTKNATLRGQGYASFVYYWMPLMVVLVYTMQLGATNLAAKFIKQMVRTVVLTCRRKQQKSFTKILIKQYLLLFGKTMQ